MCPLIYICKKNKKKKDMYSQTRAPSMQSSYLNQLRHKQCKQEQATDTVTREQRHNRPKTIKSREETGLLVRDIYIIEKDFEGERRKLHAQKTHTGRLLH